MGGMSPIHWIILAAVVLVLFGGGGKISGLMGDFAKGIKSFKKSMADEEGAGKTPESPAGHIEAPRPSVTAQSTQQDARMAEDETRGRNS